MGSVVLQSNGIRNLTSYLIFCCCLTQYCLLKFDSFNEVPISCFLNGTPGRCQYGQYGTHCIQDSKKIFQLSARPVKSQNGNPKWVLVALGCSEGIVTSFRNGFRGPQRDGRFSNFVTNL